jgi:tetratricopeptide (TPR) repeat protein
MTDARAPGFADLFTALQAESRQAVRRGDLRAAARTARRASALARASGDLHLVHLAAVNRSMVLLEKGLVQAAERGLREVILQSTDDEVICRAGFYLASALRRQNRLARARSFARLAAERAEGVGEPRLASRCLNLLGNIHLAEGNLKSAEDAYRRSLRRWRRAGHTADVRFETGIVLDNLGYCLVLQGRIAPGRVLIEEALSLARERADRRTEAECLQDLAHAHLLGGRLEDGEACAARGLALAEQAAYLDIQRNCLYLLGEMAVRRDRIEESQAYFERLQATFPDSPFLGRVLAMFDLSSMLTLH